jgi:hypothetical protein
MGAALSKLASVSSSDGLCKLAWEERMSELDQTAEEAEALVYTESVVRP